MSMMWVCHGLLDGREIETEYSYNWKGDNCFIMSEGKIIMIFNARKGTARTDADSGILK